MRRYYLVRGDTHDSPVVQLPQFFRACCVSNTQGDWGGAAWLSIPRLLAGMPRLHHSKFDPLMTGPGHFRQIDPLPTLSACPLRFDRVRILRTAANRRGP